MDAVSPPSDGRSGSSESYMIGRVSRRGQGGGCRSNTTILGRLGSDATRDGGLNADWGRHKARCLQTALIMPSQTQRGSPRSLSCRRAPRSPDNAAKSASQRHVRSRANQASPRALASQPGSDDTMRPMRLLRKCTPHWAWDDGIFSRVAISSLMSCSQCRNVSTSRSGWRHSVTEFTISRYD